MNNESLEQWLQRLECLHPDAMELGLERVSAVANKLGLLPLKQPVVTVAGTNGKGSTVAVLEALVNETGRSTGAFTSPHFLRFNERIRVAGVEVPDGEIVAAFAAIDDAREGISLTYFEFATLAALFIFRERDPDIVILEVGLGGRLDSVNIVDPALAIITSIDLDHQNWLGDSRGEIAREKAGIMRAAIPVVFAEPAPPPELLDCAAAAAAAPVLCLGRDFTVTSSGEIWQGVLREVGGGQRALAPQPLGALLPGNICAALQAALLLNVDFSPGQMQRALIKASPVGRRQLQQLAGLGYILDVAHNPAAVTKLLEYIDATPCNGRTIALFSVMKDKDINGMIRAAAGCFDAWFLGEQPANERAAPTADIAALLHEEGQNMISVSKNLRQAFRRAQSLMLEGDRLVVFGSFYTVAAVLPLLDKDRRKGGA
ncbi:MAG: bifunctional folylpolyglutamate synthase/dihydrofolate synthase [Gammaproteobacteria bacterium]|nr:MAG: bifunctional folylpolyglutamate synthase/dihydrofolate synthase [Gammaproteobacteria bacterium]